MYGWSPVFGRTSTSYQRRSTTSVSLENCSESQFSEHFSSHEMRSSLSALDSIVNRHDQFPKFCGNDVRNVQHDGECAGPGLETDCYRINLCDGRQSHVKQPDVATAKTDSFKLENFAVCSGAMPTHRRCHCIACCSCSPIVSRREIGDLAPAASCSIDSGLERIGQQSVSPSRARRQCCRSEAAAYSTCKSILPSNLSVYEQDDACSAPPADCGFATSTSTAVSELSQSTSDVEADDQDVFLPKCSVPASSVGVSPLEFHNKAMVSFLKKYCQTSTICKMQTKVAKELL